MDITRYVQKLKRFCAFADSLCNLSTCTRSARAAIIFTRDCQKISAIGYSGSVVGDSNDACLEGYRAGLAGDGLMPCGCVPADLNALIKLIGASHIEQQSLVMYSTHVPSVIAASLMVNSGLFVGLIFKHTINVMDKETQARENGLSTLHRAGIQTVLMRDVILTVPDPQLTRWMTWPEP